jgi:transposase InsO family protein
MMSLLEERKSAIHLLRSGKSVSEAAQELSRSETWVRKWRVRYDEEGWAGLESRSTRPHHIHRETSEEVKREICKARSELEAEASSGTGLKYIGGQAIRTRLRDKEIDPLPSIPTIERVIRATGMTRPYQPIEKPEVDYPHLKVESPQELVQVDIVPHYLKGGERVACFNAIDVVSRYPMCKAYAQRRSVDAGDFLLHVWRELGIPAYTQVDNEGCFSGGATHPKVLGRVLRLALQAKTELVFSPVRYPESNGFVERFHQDYDKHVWQDTYLDSVEAVQQQAEGFFKLYRQRPHSRLKEKTPDEVHREPIRTPDDLTVTSGKRVLFEGKVHFIRKVFDDNAISVLNEHYPIPKAKPNDGVWATLLIKKDGSSLHVFDAAPDLTSRKLLASFPFEIEELVVSHPASVDLPKATRSIDGYSIDKVLSSNAMS